MGQIKHIICPECTTVLEVEVIVHPVVAETMVAVPKSEPRIIWNDPIEETPRPMGQFDL